MITGVLQNFGPISQTLYVPRPIGNFPTSLFFKNFLDRVTALRKGYTSLPGCDFSSIKILHKQDGESVMLHIPHPLRNHRKFREYRLDRRF
jgi:hypothetical protein